MAVLRGIRHVVGVVGAHLVVRRAVQVLIQSGLPVVVGVLRLVVVLPGEGTLVGSSVGHVGHSCFQGAVILQLRVRVDGEPLFESILHSDQELVLPPFAIECLLYSDARIKVLKLSEGVDILFLVDDNFVYNVELVEHGNH